MLFLTRSRMRTAVSGVAAGALAATALAFAGAPAQAEDAPAVTTEVVSADPVNGLELSVQGVGFTAQPSGVYVGVADATIDVDWSDPAAASEFLDVAWVSADAFEDDQTTFNSELLVATEDLDPDADYVIHTARAHGSADRSQDTVTPVEIPWSELGLDDGGSVATPSVNSSVAMNGENVDISMQGSGFDITGAPGVYAAVTEKQDVFGKGADAFIAMNYVTPAQFTGDAFSVTLEVSPDDLTEGTEYAVYTWTAHTNPTEGDALYTETDVEIPDEAFDDGSGVVEEPAVTYSVVSADPAGGLDLQIEATGFATEPDGVHVGVARANAKIDWSDSSQGALVGSKEVAVDDFTDDTSFTTVLHIDSARLKRGTDYVIGAAHVNGSGDTSPDTVTPVQIPVNKLGLPKLNTKINKKWKKKPTSKQKSALAVAVKTGKNITLVPNGKVVVNLKKGNQTKKAQAKLNKNGKVNVKLPKLAKGKWKAAVKFGANKNFKAAKDTFNFKVNK